MSLKKVLHRIKENLHFLVFAMFALWQGAIMRYTIQYGDDYFYTTFFYGGADSFVERNVRHYLEVNGRCFVHLLDELLLAGGTITAFRIFNTLCISAIVFLTAYLAADCLSGGIRKKEFKPALISACFAFTLIDIRMGSACVFWATGAINYLFPMLPLLGMLILTERYLRSGKAGVWLPILSILTGLTVEQYSFAADCIILYALIRLLLMKKKPCILFCTTGLLTWLASASVFFAPGNVVRKTYHTEFYQQPLFERIFSNIRHLSALTVSRAGMAPALLLFFSLCVFLYLQKKHRLPVFLNGAAGIGLIFFLLSNGMEVGYFCCVFVIAALLFDLWQFFSEWRAGDSPLNLLLLLLTIGLQIAMLFSPIFGPRTSLVSFLLLNIISVRLICSCKVPQSALFVLPACAVILYFSILPALLGFALFWALCLYSLSEHARTLPKPGIAIRKTAAFLAVLTFTILPLARAFYGYRANYRVSEENERRIAAYLKNIPENQTLELYRLPNDACRYTAPYDTKYHCFWFKQSKHLPEDTILKFVPFPGQAAN